MPTNTSAAEPLFFATPAELQAWFAEHHTQLTAQWIGFRKKDSGLPSVTWPEAVDEALCVGWIDGVRKRIDDQSYMIRFTPRKARSTWSNVNIDRVADLTAQGRMQPAGLAAFAQRSLKRSGTYAYEQADPQFAPEDVAQLQANAAAWEFFQRQPAGYQRSATWWVVSAKQPATRAKRLAALIADSAAGRTVPQFTRS